MIYKDPKRGNYRIKFRWQGRVIQKRTRATSSRQARAIEAKLRAELAQGNFGILEKKPAPTLKDFLEHQFLPHVYVQFKAKPRTAQYYHEGAARLVASDTGKLKLDEITDQHARQFEARWELLSPSTINCGLRTLRRALNLAADWGRIDRRVRITLARGERQRDRVVSEDEFRMYLEKCPPLWREVATVLYGTGMRPSECYRLTWQNVHLNGSGGLIAVTEGKSKAARRLLPTIPPVYEVLKARYEAHGRPAEGYVFKTASACGHLVQGMAQKYHRKALAALATARKENPDLPKVKPFEIYCLRHSFLTRLAESGCDAFVVARIAGHSSIAITQRYCHPAQDAVERAFQVLAQGKKLVPTGGSHQNNLSQREKAEVDVSNGDAGG